MMDCCYTCPKNNHMHLNPVHFLWVISVESDSGDEFAVLATVPTVGVSQLASVGVLNSDIIDVC